mmetsp:Transcript_16181/g.50632  ORF Transcript_16181/g.50632 Transcript_16181/m.50632 type:complete len:91 (-) Transcript_16181:900-1172(-)
MGRRRRRGDVDGDVDGDSDIRDLDLDRVNRVVMAGRVGVVGGVATCCRGAVRSGEASGGNESCRKVPSPTSGKAKSKEVEPVIVVVVELD